MVAGKACHQIKYAGLDLLRKHQVSVGIELTADYLRLQKPQGSDARMTGCSRF